MAGITVEGAQGLLSVNYKSRVRVISPKRLREFGEKHPEAKPALKYWLTITRKATWRNFTELKASFAAADVVGRRTVFDLAGNHYRLIARVNYEAGRVYVLHVLTHGQYDRGDWKQ